MCRKLIIAELQQASCSLLLGSPNKNQDMSTYSYLLPEVREGVAKMVLQSLLKKV